MKRNLLTLAIAGALIAPLTSHAEPKVYGQVHLSFGQLEKEESGTTTTDNWQVRSHSSRFGIKGDHDLSEGLKAIYRLEYQVSPDDNNAKDGTVDSGSAGLKRRNQYVGLKGSWGQLRFGRHDTPLKMAQGKFDQFNNTDADIRSSSDQDGEHRLDNVLAYIGKSGDIGYAVALIPAEGDGETSGDGVADTISASVNYKSGPIYVAVAHDTYDNEVNAESDTLTRLVGTYKTGGMQIGLLYQTGVEGPTDSDNETDTIGLSFGMKTGAKGKAKLQFTTAENDASTAKETTAIAVGYDHKYSKTTRAYVMYSNNKVETGSTTNEETTFLGAGIVVKF
ncbi:MAG: porin [Gammaproteobacteria bacterium]|nr:porin [Gammaproteobacteria bacterium]